MALPNPSTKQFMCHNRRRRNFEEHVEICQFGHRNTRHIPMPNMYGSSDTASCDKHML